MQFVEQHVETPVAPESFHRYYLTEHPISGNGRSETREDLLESYTQRAYTSVRLSVSRQVGK